MLTDRFLIQRFFDSNVNSYLDCKSPPSSSPVTYPSIFWELMMELKLTDRTGIHHYRATITSVTFMKIS